MRLRIRISLTVLIFSLLYVVASCGGSEDVVQELTAGHPALTSAVSCDWSTDGKVVYSTFDLSSGRMIPVHAMYSGPITGPNGKLTRPAVLDQSFIPPKSVLSASLRGLVCTEGPGGRGAVSLSFGRPVEPPDDYPIMSRCIAQFSCAGGVNSPVQWGTPFAATGGGLP